MEKPRFVHDCDKCTFLGQFLEYDLYYCPQGNIPTVIARFGDEGWDYRSGMYCAEIDPVLKEARKRAKEKGLI